MSNKLTIELMQQLAKDKGGKCLSKQYINNHTPLEWMCRHGHRWKTSPANIKNNGHWCRKCGHIKVASKKKLTIELIQQLARDKGGECLSAKYVDAHTKLKWICAEGHSWWAPPMAVRRGRWCRLCAIKKTADKQRGSLQEMRKIAAARGGKCLSEKYITARKKLKWSCSENHIWEATPDSIKRGRWCSRCTKTFREEICRTVFEQIFEDNFEKWAPRWLKNRRGNQMYVDGFNKTFNIAFEYQGEQHTRITRFSETEEKLKKQKANDRLKRKLLKSHGVNLIVISYRQNLVNLPHFIKKRAESFDLDSTGIDFEKEIDFNKVYRHKTHLKTMQDIALKRGGACLSTKYVNARTHLEWVCEKGHHWSATPDNVKRGTWCKECYQKGRSKLTTTPGELAMSS